MGTKWVLIGLLALTAPFSLLADEGTLSHYKTVRCDSGDAVQVKYSNDRHTQVCYRSKENTSLQGYTVNSESGRFHMWVFNDSNFMSFPFRIDRPKAKIRFGHQGLGPFKVSILNPETGQDLRLPLTYENSVSGAVSLSATGNMSLKVDASAPWYIIIE